MDKYFKNQLYKWTYEKIESNPYKYGGDYGNAIIMHSYMMEHFSDKMVLSLEVTNYSTISTISRIRNKLLEKNPQFDKRVKYKPKKRNKSFSDDEEKSKS